MCIVIVNIIVGMIDREFGHIVNISSVFGKSGIYSYSSYCAAKFAIFGLMDSVRYEVCCTESL